MRHLLHSHHHVERRLDSSPFHLDPQAVNGEMPTMEKRQPQVETVVSVVFTTAPKTFPGPIAGYTTALPSGDSFHHGTLSLSSAAQATPEPSTNPEHTGQHTPRPQPASTAQPTEQSSSEKPTSTAAQTSSGIHASSSSTSPSTATVAPESSAIPGSYSVAPAEPSSQQAATTDNATTAPAASSSPSEVSKSSGGMSGGAKAGLAFGIIILIALIAAGAFFLYRRKKRQEDSHERLADNEKVATPAELPRLETTTSVSTTRSAMNAPRLSLRPLTQFSPNLGGGERKSFGNKLEMTSNPNAASQGKSMWERPGERSNVTESVNPFGDDAATAAAVGGAAAVAGATAGAVATGKAIDRRRSSDVVPKPLSIKSNNSQTSLASSAANSAVSSAPSGAPSSEFQLGTAATASTAIPSAVGAAAVPPSLAAPSEPPSNVHRVQMEFKPSMEDELELRPGQLVRILHEYDDGWALCIRMDRSHQGVAPRTCLSKLPLKPRPVSPQGQQPGSRPTGPLPMRPPVGLSSMVPRPLTPTSGRSSPANPFADAFAQSAGRARSKSNAPAPQQSLTPGAYSGGGQAEQAQQSRRRSKSVTDLQPMTYQGPMSSHMPIGHASSSSMGSMSSIPTRKPVPGQPR